MYVADHADDWFAAYKEAQKLKVAGMQGYLAAPSTAGGIQISDFRMSMFNLMGQYKEADVGSAPVPWVGFTRLMDGDKQISSDTEESNLKLANLVGTNKNGSVYYYADGPDQGTAATSASIWNQSASKEPNGFGYEFWQYPRGYNDASCAAFVSLTWESYPYYGSGCHDLPYKNASAVASSTYRQNQPSGVYDTNDVTQNTESNGTPKPTGYMVFFGGYAANQDPGGRNE